MSLLPINDDNIEYFSIEAHPSRSYSAYPRRDGSGSKIYFTGSQGRQEERLDKTGSVNIFTHQSTVEKEAAALVNSSFAGFNDDSIESVRSDIASATSTDVQAPMETYMGLVNASTQSLRQAATQEIIRFTPTVGFTSNTLRKTLLTNHLMPYHRPALPSMHFNYTNYNSLNFIVDPPNATDFPFPSSSAILYPNPRGPVISAGVYSSDYGVDEGEPFSFDFWIKPTHTVGAGEDYVAGGIMHLTGAYAVSLHSGSFKDQDGRPTKFKLMLQLGSGSGTPPSLAVEDSSNSIYVSTDDALELNKWHHVSICYGGNNFNHGSGSFYVDTEPKGAFSFQSPGFGLWNETVSPTLAPAVLCVGNFFNGPGVTEDFFNTTTATRDGLVQLSSGSSEPAGFDLLHPLGAELHDLKIYSKCLNTDEIEDLQTAAPTNLANLKFYVPPFFTEESPHRTFVGEHGGVMVTPFFQKNGSSDKPYAKEFAFGANGHYTNLENYTRDFVTGRFPRLWNLTGSMIEPGNSVVEEANTFLYSSSSMAGGTKKRLYSLLPCDHGDWDPNFNLLNSLSGALPTGTYKNDLDNTVLGMVTLRDIMTGSLVPFSTQTSGSIVDELFGVGPEPVKLVETPTDDFTIFNRLKDGDSNQVVVFDISNLFYGKQILPGSLTLRDTAISGSDGALAISLKDDGIGNLYRADATGGTHATWASVGNVFYDEGLVLIKNPQLYFFGSEGFELDFKGMHNLHVMTVNCYARSQHLVSSSNPTYDPTLLADEELANTSDQRFVYITGLNIHDENLNVIGRSHLAQPIMKKTGEKMLFKWKIDF